MLETLWHIECKSTIEYSTGELKVGNINLPSSRDSTKFIKMQNLGVKEFGSLQPKKKTKHENLVVYQERAVNNTAMDNKFIKENLNDEELLELKKEFQSIFTNELLDGLLQKWAVHHKIETRLYQPYVTVEYFNCHQWKPSQLRSMWRSCFEKGNSSYKISSWVFYVFRETKGSVMYCNKLPNVEPHLKAQNRFYAPNQRNFR